MAIPKYHEQLPFHVNKWHITANDLVMIDDNEFVIETTTDSGHSFLPNGKRVNKSPQFFTHEDFDRMYRDGRVSFDFEYFAEHRRELRLAHANKPLDMLTGIKKAKAEYLLAMIEGFEALQVDGRRANGRKIKLSRDCLLEVLPGLHESVKSKASPELFEAIHLEKVRMPEPRTFMTHVATYNKFNRDPLRLAPLHRGPGRIVRPEIEESTKIWVEEVNSYANLKKPLPSIVLKAINARIAVLNKDRPGTPLVAPGREMLKSMLDALSSYHILAGREGPEFARKHFQPYVGGIEVQRPGQRVEMDEWRTDLLTILEATRYLEFYPRRDRRKLKKVRIWITAIIDTATRCILGMQFGLTPSAEMALRTIEMMTMDKTEYGETMGAQTPWHHHCGAKTFVTDQGSSFMRKEVRFALASLGCTNVKPAAKESEKRPFIESLFKGLKLFMRHLDGQTFANIWERGDYDPASKATATIDFLNKYMVRAVVDVYHNQAHDNLLQESPHVRWTRLTDKYHAVPPPGHALRRNIFGLKDTRVVSENGILVLGIRYTCPNLVNVFIRDGGIARANMRDPLEVDVRIDRHRMSAISYFDKYENAWIPAQNTCRLPDDTSAAELIETGRRVRDRNASNRSHNDQIYWEAFDELRRSGEAAAARAEIGDQKVDIEYIRAEERKLVHVYKNGLRERMSIDAAPVNRPTDVLKMDVYDREEIPDYDEVDDGELLLPDEMARGDAEVVKAKPARYSGSSERSKPGRSTGVSFDDDDDDDDEDDDTDV